MRGLGKKFGLFVKIALLAAGVMPARAGGPLYVTGYTSEKPGQPYRWILNPVPYKTDRGGLGNQTNTGATALVRDAFQAWQDVDTAERHHFSITRCLADRSTPMFDAVARMLKS